MSGGTAKGYQQALCSTCQSNNISVERAESIYKSLHMQVHRFFGSSHIDLSTHQSQPQHTLTFLLPLTFHIRHQEPNSHYVQIDSSRNFSLHLRRSGCAYCFTCPKFGQQWSQEGYQGTYRFISIVIASHSPLNSRMTALYIILNHVLYWIRKWHAMMIL